MPSDSIAGFLDQARATHLLPPDQVEDLAHQPDAPQSGVGALADYLERRGVLTRFQADMLRTGRGGELNVAGFPLVEEIGPCPGGTAFRALHPARRTPVVVRKVRTDWLAPADNAAAFAQRARTVAGLPHPHLVPLLDAGVYQDELYAALEWPDAADLHSLVQGIGPMPTFLACEYARQVAAALAFVHDRGVFHGDVRPGNVRVGPLIPGKPGPDGKPRMKPGPAATAALAETGLTPIRPPAAAFPLPEDVLAYLPPERADAPAYDFRGDVYGLGATLYFLLTGRPPFAAPFPSDLLAKVRTAAPPKLAALRPDLPAGLVDLVQQMMAKQPADRPAAAAEVVARLATFARPAPVAPAVVVPAPAVIPAPAAVPYHGPDSQDALSPPAPAGHDPDGHWGPASSVFSTKSAEDAPRPRKAVDRGKVKRWLVAGFGLHMFAMLLLALLILSLRGAITLPWQEDNSPPQTTPKKRGAKKAEAPVVWVAPARA